MLTIKVLFKWTIPYYQMILGMYMWYKTSNFVATAFYCLTLQPVSEKLLVAVKTRLFLMQLNCCHVNLLLTFHFLSYKLMLTTTELFKRAVSYY